MSDLDPRIQAWIDRQPVSTPPDEVVEKVAAIVHEPARGEQVSA